MKNKIFVSSYDKWNIVLCGPEKTPYEGGPTLFVTALIHNNYSD